VYRLALSGWGIVPQHLRALRNLAAVGEYIVQQALVFLALKKSDLFYLLSVTAKAL
jgi:hypothetical protein